MAVRAPSTDSPEKRRRAALKLASGGRPSQNGPVTSHAATMGPATGTSHPRVLHVRAAGFPRRATAALIDMALVLLVAAGVSVGAAVLLGVPLPRTKELGPDLLLAGILDRNPMAVGALGLLVGV